MPWRYGRSPTARAKHLGQPLHRGHRLGHGRTHRDRRRGRCQFRTEIAIDASGNALAVWDQSDGTRNNIWSNRYTAGGGWGTAELIETDNAAVPQPRDRRRRQRQCAGDLASSPTARATGIWSNRYTVGTGWGTAALIETDNAGDAADPQIAIDGNGNALAVWDQSDGTRRNIWSNRYTAGVGWGTAS